MRKFTRKQQARANKHIKNIMARVANTRSQYYDVVHNLDYKVSTCNKIMRLDAQFIRLSDKRDKLIDKYLKRRTMENYP